MLAKIWTSVTVLLALSLQVHGHAAVAPVIGVSGTPKRSDVKRPSTANPCGAGVNIATALGSATPVAAAADGTFTTTVTNFNGGKDGSRQVSAKVDAAGTGRGFVAATVSKNGDGNPTSTGSEQIVAKLPAGTACKGGATGDVCLVQFTTTAGFGNCVAVQQEASATAAAAVKKNREGTRAPRALLTTIEARGEGAIQAVKRGISNWIWA
ncbi:hypothetical protein BDQ17DRAFT_1235099 [Cyathus striatus]|nr:hypothetical protein BDQ17DRAFT_1235099 [Cyathus striatus]